MTPLKHILIILLVLTTGLASGQVEFKANVSKTTLGINERLRIDFEMNKDGDNFNPPDFSNFEAVGPQQSVSNSWINGVRTFKKTYTYFLTPIERGTFTIGQATITIDGQVYKTIPQQITVTAAVDKPKDPNDPNYVASENIHLIAEVSKTNPYLNEAITVIYKLYVSPRVQVDTWNEKDSPRYNDFWSQNIDTQNQQVQTEMFKGENYRSLILKKTVLYPQKTGKLNIEPLVLDMALRVPTNRRDIFGNYLLTRVNRTITAGNKTIDVKPLPQNGKPADFTGAVGDFNFNISTSKKRLNASESLQIKVEVQGNGNLKLFKLPKVSLPSSLEVYEPEHQENITTNLNGMRGNVTDTYTVVPQYKGKYPIPSISFSYFDLTTQTYKRLSSDEIIIDVEEGPLNTADANAQNALRSGTKQPITLNKDQFVFIKTKTDLVSKTESSFFKTRLFWLLLLLPFLAIPIAILIMRNKAIRDADVRGNRIRKADKLSKKYLSAAKKSLGKKEAFYIALEKAVHNYLKARIHIETSDLSKDKISELLRERQVEPDVIKDFLSIVESCDLARYTPMTNVTMQEDYEKASKTISLIDKQAR
ncbi:BatD family protein [Gaetbulibacter sp. M240]|uniref:BatD family protein n=1 Tax=Gaetbulibacter sp. M240 TaxID=3126511 RepID=UPI00374E36B5